MTKYYQHKKSGIIGKAEDGEEDARMRHGTKSWMSPYAALVLDRLPAWKEITRSEYCEALLKHTWRQL